MEPEPIDYKDIVVSDSYTGPRIESVEDITSKW